MTCMRGYMQLYRCILQRRRPCRLRRRSTYVGSQTLLLFPAVYEGQLCLALDILHLIECV